MRHPLERSGAHATRSPALQPHDLAGAARRLGPAGRYARSGTPAAAGPGRDPDEPQAPAILRRSSASSSVASGTPISRATSRSARPDRVASWTISVARS